MPGAIREGDEYIEIDQDKKRWPFIRAQTYGPKKIIFLSDCNEGGQIIGENHGRSAIQLSRKKARRLGLWLVKITADD